MRSAPIPAGVAESASSVLLAARAPQLSCRTSAPTRAVHRFAHPLFSYCYKLLFPQLLCFDDHLRCPIVFLALPRNPGSSGKSAANRTLTPVLTYCCGLFVVAKRFNSFAIKQIRTLFGKDREWGYLASSDPRTSRPSRSGQRAATWTPRAHPTIIAVSSRFQSHG